MKSNDESRLQEFLEKPERALWSIALPVMAGMAIQTMYSIVDMLFIGRLGGESITAVAIEVTILQELQLRKIRYEFARKKVRFPIWSLNYLNPLPLQL